ncbi:MAG: glycosyl transferase, family 4 [Gemmatimonadetes bacterium]|nr:glycosyl transferase, family 4 [Gemmatimonadota bacterium]
MDSLAYQVVESAFHPTALVASAAAILAVAYLSSALTQPIVRRIAFRLGFLDYPDAERRLHAQAVPRLGGVGVFVALLVAGSVAAAVDSGGHFLTQLPLILATTVGGALLFLAGLADDIKGVPPVGKLLVQTAAALIVYRYGFRIQHAVIPGGFVIDLDWMALPVTVLWIVGLSNAFNLVDGADGLAGGVAIIALLATAASAMVTGDQPIVWCSLALIGAMLGFLRYNWPPARIFLGDSGSLVVGFLLAILTVKGMSRADGAVYGIAPIFALSYPLLDTGISMLRRWLRGDSLSRADGRHIHHQLQALGLGPRQTLLVLYGLSAFVAALGLSATFAPPELTIAVAVAGAATLALILVYGAQWLEYHELIEAGASIGSAVMTARQRVQDKIYARDVAQMVARARTTNELRAVIEDSADLFRFTHMELRWGTSRAIAPVRKVSPIDPSRLWALDYPISGKRGRKEPLFLCVWCSVDSIRAAGAERVTKIIASAVEQWIVHHEEEVHTGSFENYAGAKSNGVAGPVDIAGHVAKGRERSVSKGTKALEVKSLS